MGSLNRLAVAVEGWRRLWRRGEEKDKENINNNNTNNTKNKHKKKKQTTASSKPRKKRTKKHNHKTHSQQQILIRQDAVHQELQQTTLAGNNQTASDCEEFADIMGPKNEYHLRIVLQNTNLLPTNGRSSKSRKLMSFLANKQVDIALLNEIGVYWKILDNASRWYERVREAFKSTRSSLGYNTNEHSKTKEIQYGGTIAMAIDDATHRVVADGCDSSGLGRWTWLRLEGKHGHHLRVVSAYRPVESIGPRTVYSQHDRYFNSKGRTEVCPRQAFYDDLFDEISEWKEQGDHIVVGIDANEDVRTGATRDTFRALYMREVILEKHSHLSPPATCDKNNQRQPIDGIFATSGIRIKHGGYSAFNSGCPSDHRYLWVDIATTIAFGYDAPAFISPEVRRLRADDPRHVSRYNKAIRKGLTSEGLLVDLKVLASKADQDGWSEELEEEYNRINDIQYKIRKKAAKNVRKLRKGAVPWSPRLQTFRTAIEIWTMLLKKRKGQKVSNQTLRRLLVASDIEGAFSLNAAQVSRKLDEAFKAYKVAKKDAAVWRNEFLESLARARADRKGTEVAAELKQLRTIELQRRTARNIKRMRKKLGQNAVTKISVTDSQGTRRAATEKDDMEQVAATENEARFSQSERTPPMVEPLLSDLGYLAQTDAAKDILAGTYIPPPGTDFYASLFLKELYMPESARLNPMPQPCIDSKDQSSAWAKQKERTSSDPAGLTFSHYKCTLHDEELAEFDAFIRHLPYRHGFSPEHWQQITDVEILKKSGVYDIEGMRTITLMDAAFNMNNKKLGREIIAHAEKLYNLAAEQFGSRKHHRSNICGLNKVLTMDLFRLRRQAAALCSNDAKSCYDRVVHSIAALCALRQGCPPGPIISMLKTLQKSWHRIRTAFGVSDLKYGGDREVPMQGLGQGNGFAPTGWALISTPLIMMMRSAGFGVNLVSCLSMATVAFVCYAFVDDTDIVHCGPSVNSSGKSVFLSMRRFVAHWEGGLRATGGALRVDKSYWYMIDFIWKNGRWRYASKEDLPGDILVLNAAGERELLPRHEPAFAEETLGIYIAMDGNHKKEVEKLRSKADEFADCIRTGFVTRDEAWQALKSTIMKTLEYPMAAISLTKSQWDYILKPILRMTLPRAGLVRSFPRVVLFAPESFSGFGLVHPYHKQHLTHLDVCLGETIQEGITSSLLVANLEQLRLEAGLSGIDDNWHISSLDKCLTDCWLKHTLRFCEDFGLALHDTAPRLQPLSTNDIFLMESFIAAGYSPHDLSLLNECRMYLHAITLSDIVTADMKYILLDSFDGKRVNCSRLLEWPRSPPRLTSTHWILWRRALTKCFFRAGNTRREIRFDLGTWLPSVLDTWPWFYSPTEHRLFHREGPFWRVWAHSSQRTRRHSTPRFSSIPGLQASLPSDAILATTSSQARSTVQITGSATPPIIIPPAVPRVNDMSIEDILDTRMQDDLWAVSSLFCPDDGYSLAQAILCGTATAVSDGSYKSNLGTSAFLLRGSNRSISALGSNVVPGNPSEHSSYRSELAGISGSLAIISAVCDKYDITSGSITIGLDGEQALKKAASTWPLSPQDTDFDLLTDLRAKIRKLRVDIRWEWIKGHQDDDVDFADLSFLAQDNVIVDGVAKHRLNSLLASNYISTSQRFGDEGWSVHLGASKLSKMDHSKLYEHFFNDDIKDYWATKHHLPRDLINTIDWDVCGAAIRSLSVAKKRRVIKHLTGHFGVGAKMLTWKFQDHAECPRCQDYETPKHVILCSDPSCDPKWETSLTNLTTFLHRRNTRPELIQLIISGLRSWKNDALPLSPHRDLDLLVASQNNIGWYPFLMGHISHHWQGIQQEYYSWLGRRNTGRQWAIQLVVQLFNVSWDMWEHRNGILHGSSTPAKLRAIAQRDAIIRHEYDVGITSLLARDQRWFSKGLINTLQYSIEEKDQWIASVNFARTRWRRRHEVARASMAARRTLLRNWLNITNLPLVAPAAPVVAPTAPPEDSTDQSRPTIT